MKQSTTKIFHLLAILFAIGQLPLSAQYKFSHNWDHPVDFAFRSSEPNGFVASISLVALFTTGVADRSGIRIGVGGSLAYTYDNWTAKTGVDFFKAKQKFGLGASYAGVTFFDGEYGGSYFLSHYYQGDTQTSGIVSLTIKDFSLRFEDDILAYPFVGFKVYDRYRTAALELRYKGLMVGTNVYTTDITGQTTFDTDNEKGCYQSGKQISSPIYIGYADRDMLIRLGLNSSLGGKIGQNLWHKFLFDTPNFKEGDYNNKFLQIGVDKPYTLY